MEDTDVCSSCGNKLIYKGSTRFPCPACGNTKIGRCPTCRDQSVAYKCKDCGFSGP